MSGEGGPTLRLFVAAPLPDALRREVGLAAGAVRPRLPAASWPDPMSLHLTLAFIGAVAPGLVEPVARELEAVAGVPPAAVTVSGAGFFPSDRRPRVAWIGLAPAERIDPIAAAVREALGRARVTFDAKPFRPHLTLARIKAPWRREDVERFREAFAPLAGTAVRVDRVNLYESRLSSKGATHVALKEIALG